ncbi:MAG: hypothetical protein JRI85_12570 [Deltaproteobacteria bacterium]|nr:hypothetical protein [Deltaproteobacteria bacterium]
MNEFFETTKVLITVMTYPLPSRGYLETVCTAGITENYEWVRLYPIDYRYLPDYQKFRKYQWIEVELAQRGQGNDNRKESRKPKLDSIKLLGEPLSLKNGWKARREIISKMPVSTRKQLEVEYDKDKTSLGIVKPIRVLDLKVEATKREWKPEWQHVLNQFYLFGESPKSLTKIPFDFRYIFECEDSEQPHSAMIEDWELGVLYLKELARLGDEVKAVESVRNKFLNDLCSDEKETLFFMGTTFPYNSWVVLGVYYPPKTDQMIFDF